MAAALPGLMMYPVFLLLLGQFVKALQFGKLFKPIGSNYMVTRETVSEIHIDGAVYYTALRLEADSLIMPFVKGMGLWHIPKNSGAMVTLSPADDEVKMQPGDVLIIYKSGSATPDLYRGATAENLEKMLRDNSPTAVVFGVVIQDDSAPSKKVAQSAPNYGFTDMFSNEIGGSPMEISQSIVLVKAMGKTPQTAYIDADGNLKVTLMRRQVLDTNGIATIGQIVEGDCFIMVVAVEGGNTGKAMVEELLNKLPGGFAETMITNVKNYLEEVTIVGEGKVTHGSFPYPPREASWFFDGDTMVVRNRDLLALRVKINDKGVDGYADKRNFAKERVELSNLEPRDIVVILGDRDDLGSDFDVSNFKKSLSSCKNSTDLRDVLMRVKTSDSINIMAAFITNEIPSSVLKMASITTNQAAIAADPRLSWAADDSGISVSLAGTVSASASINFVERNKVSIQQSGGAMALIFDIHGGLKHRLIALESQNVVIPP
ncbi:hypothetical protein PSACC_01769 [Paramicrosporidium saccamoebae]|uniref:Uncharacterized protein n=1 Tax=Paramicrosporidium saccamoebae TaxID=1246581 RepID=A0A2H9TLC4_9FUNG|nr:hypothetical protein PSACC_01769 [Paramicrosporidium saccamoebae]